ncbi:hypothetical protein, partial [Cohnella fermenti]|uniref:hypothetical protein n=1 Tax=Cohnella fermenti TaxID=2565925 RepID=UPI001B3B1E78
PPAFVLSQDQTLHKGTFDGRVSVRKSRESKCPTVKNLEGSFCIAGLSRRTEAPLDDFITLDVQFSRNKLLLWYLVVSSIFAIRFSAATFIIYHSASGVCNRYFLFPFCFFPVRPVRLIGNELVRIRTAPALSKGRKLIYHTTPIIVKAFFHIFPRMGSE